MRKEYDFSKMKVKYRVKNLIKKYPAIFKNCKTIATGDGWYWLLDKLCNQLTADESICKYPQVEAIQVKEKFGTLRFYVKQANPHAYGIILFVEGLSAYICEECGSIDNVVTTKGCIKTICKPCLKRWKNE